MKKWIAAAALVIVGTGVAKGFVMYGVAPFDVNVPSNLYRIDPSTGAATLIGSTGFSRMAGLAFSPGGVLYGYTPGALYTIDPTSGAATRVGLLGSDHPEGDLSFRPAAGVLFGTKSTLSDELVTIDLATGASTTVGLLGPAGRDTSGLAFLPDGTLFGAAFRDGAADELIRIDAVTGAATIVGPLGTNVGTPAVGGLAYDAGGGVMYYSDGASLYTVDTATGAASAIGAHGVTTMAAIAIDVPEPAAAAGAVAMGLAVYAAVARRRHDG